MGSAALDAVYPDAGTRSPSPSSARASRWPPWTVREVWIAAGPDPDHYVDVTATFPRKIAALRAHESQTGHMDDLEERLRTRLGLTARMAGLPEGRLAEPFQVLDTA